MEETNYHRATVGIVEVSAGSDTPAFQSMADDNNEKTTSVNKAPETVVTGDTVQYRSEKTFVQKLSLWQPSPGLSPFKRSLASLKFLGWPVIFYCGFSYGSYLVSGLHGPIWPPLPTL